MRRDALRLIARAAERLLRLDALRASPRSGPCPPGDAGVAADPAYPLAKGPCPGPYPWSTLGTYPLTRAREQRVSPGPRPRSRGNADDMERAAAGRAASQLRPKLQPNGATAEAGRTAPARFSESR